MEILCVINRISACTAAAVLLLLALAACTSDFGSAQTIVPASAEPFDLASLNGKVIRVDTLSSGDFWINETPMPGVYEEFRVVGKTIIWNGPWYQSECVLNGTSGGERLAVLFTPDQPRSDVKVPCEGERRFFEGSYIGNEPADVRYSSTLRVEGNTLELTGGLHERNATTFENSHFTADITQQLHATLRLSADKCQVLDYSWTTEVRGTDPFHAYTDKRATRATRCSITTP